MAPRYKLLYDTQLLSNLPQIKLLILCPGSNCSVYVTVFYSYQNDFGLKRNNGRINNIWVSHMELWFYFVYK